jgi:hypothetical protein
MLNRRGNNFDEKLLQQVDENGLAMLYAFLKSQKNIMSLLSKPNKYMCQLLLLFLFKMNHHQLCTFTRQTILTKLKSFRSFGYSSAKALWCEIKTCPFALIKEAMEDGK